MCGDIWNPPIKRRTNGNQGVAWRWYEQEFGYEWAGGYSEGRMFLPASVNPQVDSIAVIHRENIHCCAVDTGHAVNNCPLKSEVF